MHKDNITYKEQTSRDIRLLNHEDITALRPYILALKERDLGSIKCEQCGNTDDLNIHHKKYGLDVNYYDLELLCFDCHR